MSPYQPIIDAAYREYAELHFLRHEMLLDGRGDTTEIAHTEDQMDEIWANLDDVQRQSLNGMASDLNWIRRNGEPPPKGRKFPEEVSEAERQELITAMASKQWHQVLHFLRICAPTLPPANLALLRGKAYNALGLPAYGNAFFEQAADFAAANASLDVAALGDRIRKSK